MMKKLQLIFFLVCLGSCLWAQEAKNGSYLSISGKGGVSGFNYDLNYQRAKGSQTVKAGYNGEIAYSYYFTNHWGVFVGAGVSYYSSVEELKEEISKNRYNNLSIYTDMANKEYELRTRIGNFKEEQTTYFIDIPIMLRYQTHFGAKENWGIYGGIGIKLQLPFNSKFKIGKNSQFNVSGYYVEEHLEVGFPDSDTYKGFGTITDPNATLNWNNDLDLKMGLAGTAEIGFLFKLAPKVDILLGGYIDYGFTDINKREEKGLFKAPEAYYPAVNGIGYGIGYNGIMNSDVTGKVKPFSAGGKLTFRFKL